jgi:hypothetical protein
MAYQVRWRLIGRYKQLLDRGRIDDCHDTYADAAAAVSELLRAYPEATRSEDCTYWRARRSADADLEVHVWIEVAEMLVPDIGSGCRD